MDSPVRRIGLRENDERVGNLLNLAPFGTQYLIYSRDHDKISFVSPKFGITGITAALIYLRATIQVYIGDK